VIEDKRLNKSTLDDNADIYRRRDAISEKQKLSEMNFKEKLEYFNTYYKYKTIAIIAATVFVIYFLYTVLTPKPETVLYSAVINYAISEEQATIIQEEFGDYLDINPDKENILIDTSFYLGTSGDFNQVTMTNEEKLQVYLFGSDIDIIIAPESSFSKYASFDYFEKLSDQLPTDLISKLADSFYYSTTDENPTNTPYGIYLDNAKIYDNSGKRIERPILGIVVNSEHKSNAVEFVRYIFSLY
jgi:hypothetical protein